MTLKIIKKGSGERQPLELTDWTVPTNTRGIPCKRCTKSKTHGRGPCGWHAGTFGAENLKRKKAIIGTAASESQVRKVLRASSGLTSPAAKALGVSYQSLVGMVNRYDLHDYIFEQRERSLDIAETKLAELVKQGNLGAICFTLKCIGKHRGWVERQEITGRGGAPIATSNIDLTKLSTPTLKAVLAESVVVKQIKGEVT